MLDAAAHSSTAPAIACLIAVKTLCAWQLFLTFLHADFIFEMMPDSIVTERHFSINPDFWCGKLQKRAACYTSASAKEYSFGAAFQPMTYRCCAARCRHDKLKNFRLDGGLSK